MRRSLETRGRLVAVAERLFAERSIEGVSLNEISKAAGQRNSNACQYHFGDKQGLLQAILDKHVPGIAAQREALLAALERLPRRQQLRALVQAFVRPVASKLHDADGGRNFIRINAQLIALHTLSVRGGLPASPLRLAQVDRLRRAMRRTLRAAQVPDAVAEQRLMLAAVLLFHGLDDHARMLDIGARGAAADPRLFVANLEESIVAMLAAPVPAAMRSTCRS